MTGEPGARRDPLAAADAILGSLLPTSPDTEAKVTIRPGARRRTIGITTGFSTL